MERMQVKWEGVELDIEIYSITYTEPCHPRRADCWVDVIGGYEIDFRAYHEETQIKDVLSLTAIEKLIIKSIEAEHENT
jgi:hypothetical protein